MKITFFSNFMNHHQLPFSQAMVKQMGDGYTFLASKPLPEEQATLGYRDMNKQYPFVLTTYDSAENRKKAMALALDSDAIITGSAPERYTHRRIKHGKLTFRYSERLFKRGPWERFAPHKVWRLAMRHRRWQKAPLYMLCASAYAAADYAAGGAYIGKTYKWGYFPAVERLDMDAVMAQKKQNAKITLLWVARLIPLKHPEVPLRLAARLKAEGYDFQLCMIGGGKLHDALAAKIGEMKLDDCVTLCGSMPPEMVRTEMENADIFLFTSDFHEGWGAVLNESMSSGCAVVASHAIGSVPFLIENGRNGLIYKNGSDIDLYEKTKRLMDSQTLRERLGRAAYETMANEWNAEEAARRFLTLCDALQNGRETPYTTGPCSRAEKMRNNWFNG